MGRTIPQGVYPQIWLGSPGFSRILLARNLDTFAELALPGVVLHGGPRSLEHSWASLAAMAASRGLLCLAGFGLDGHDDSDGTVLTATEKAHCMASIAVQPGCAGVVQDAEVQYDSGIPSSDGAIDADVLGREFRRLAPDAYVVHQPWFQPTVHWRFPFEAFAIEADEVAPEVYVNDFIRSLGRQRYRIVWSRYTTAWTKLETRRLASIGQVDPRFPTIQSYAWDDILPDLVHCLLHYPKLFAWSQPFPPPLFLTAIRFVRVLEHLGLYSAARTETYDSAVLSFQRDYNATAISKITEDGRAGPQTFGAAGLIV